MVGVPSPRLLMLVLGLKLVLLVRVGGIFRAVVADETEAVGGSMADASQSAGMAFSLDEFDVELRTRFLAVLVIVRLPRVGVPYTFRPLLESFIFDFSLLKTFSASAPVTKYREFLMFLKINVNLK